MLFFPWLALLSEFTFVIYNAQPIEILHISNCHRLWSIFAAMEQSVCASTNIVCYHQYATHSPGYSALCRLLTCFYLFIASFLISNTSPNSEHVQRVHHTNRYNDSAMPERQSLIVTGHDFFTGKLSPELKRDIQFSNLWFIYNKFLLEEKGTSLRKWQSECVSTKLSIT